MAKNKRNRHRPKQAQHPSKSARVRQTEDPSSFDKQTVAWRISEFDYGGPWGDEALDGQDLQELIRGWAHRFETQTWGALLTAAGGRKSGTNHHPIDVHKLSKQAQKRLEEIHKEDLVDSIFSFRVSGIVRVYGIRDGRVFNVLWFDPWHNDKKKAVCPSGKKNT